MTILSAKNLKKSYGQLTALSNLNFEIQEKEIFGLLGPNGAGKTTTIECILGLKSLDAGEVKIFGKDVSSVYSKIGVQFQKDFFPARIKVYEICEMMASLYQQPEDYHYLLDLFSLEDKSTTYVHNLSGGQQQKLSILLALINKPTLVFLDELTTGLDPEARREVWKILEDLRHKGLTIFLTSHNMDEAAALCDTLMIIKNGKKIISGTPEFIIQSAGTTYLEDAYLHYMEVRS